MVNSFLCPYITYNCCKNNTLEFLHLHEIVERLYIYFCLSLCVCVCVCVCVCPSVNKMPIEPLHWFWRSLRKTVAFSTGSDPIEIDDLCLKVKVTFTKYPISIQKKKCVCACARVCTCMLKPRCINSIIHVLFVPNVFCYDYSGTYRCWYTCSIALVDLAFCHQSIIIQ